MEVSLDELMGRLSCIPNRDISTPCPIHYDEGEAQSCFQMSKSSFVVDWVGWQKALSRINLLWMLTLLVEKDIYIVNQD